MTFRGRLIAPRAAGRRKPLRLVARCVEVFDACYGNLSRLAAIQEPFWGPFFMSKNKLVNERNRKNEAIHRKIAINYTLLPGVL